MSDIIKYTPYKCDNREGRALKKGKKFAVQFLCDGIKKAILPVSNNRKAHQLAKLYAVGNPIPENATFYKEAAKE